MPTYEDLLFVPCLFYDESEGTPLCDFVPGCKTDVRELSVADNARVKELMDTPEANRRASDCQSIPDECFWRTHGFSVPDAPIGDAP